MAFVVRGTIRGFVVRKEVCVGPSSVAGTMWNVAEVQKPVFGSLVSRVSRL